MNDILIIPDVHGRTFWKEALLKYPDVPTIFLGDYHDPYPYEKISESTSLTNFQQIVDYARNHPNVTLLLGNHDLHYLCNFGEGCRFDYYNCETIKDLILANRDLFRIADYRTMGGKTILFSHAPILTDWIDDVKESYEVPTLVGNLNRLVGKIESDPDDLKFKLRCISFYRGGYDPFGSPIWADMNEIKEDNTNLIPSPDYSIFGHTQLPTARITDKWANLDSRNAFLLNDKLKLIQV